jgi:hypothetical protein
MRLVLLGCSCAPTSALAVDSARALATAAARSDAAQAPVGYGDEQRHKLLTASSCHARRRRRRAARPQGPAAPRRAAHQGRPLPELPARDRERCGRAILPALLLRGGERGKTGSAPSMPVPMQSIASRGEEDEQGGGASSCPRRTVFVGGVDELHLSITMERHSIFASPFGSSVGEEFHSAQCHRRAILGI